MNEPLYHVSQSKNPASVSRETVLHEQLALKRLRQATRPPGWRRLGWIVGRFIAIFRRVEPVREVAPGVVPLRKDQWDGRYEKGRWLV